MGRPRVKLRLISSFLLERERATAREVAYGLQLSIADASKQLDRLRAGGEATVLERVRVQHARRPVAVYGPVQASRCAIFSDDWLR
jgi:hypothetical protein